MASHGRSIDRPNHSTSQRADRRAKMLFEEWNLGFGSICGNAFSKEGIQVHLADFAEEVDVEDMEGN